LPDMLSLIRKPFLLLLFLFYRDVTHFFRPSAPFCYLMGVLVSPRPSDIFFSPTCFGFFFLFFTSALWPLTNVYFTGILRSAIYLWASAGVTGCLLFFFSFPYRAEVVLSSPVHRVFPTALYGAPVIFSREPAGCFGVPLPIPIYTQCAFASHESFFFYGAPLFLCVTSGPFTLCPIGGGFSVFHLRIRRFTPGP